MSQPVDAASLEVGMVFRLTATRRMEDRPEQAPYYEVLTRDPSHRLGAHLMVRVVGTETVREVYVWPWQEIELVGASPEG